MWPICVSISLFLSTCVYLYIYIYIHYKHKKANHVFHSMDRRDEEARFEQAASV